MASNVSQAYTESKSQFRDGDCDGEEEEDGEEMLDPRVKGELDRLNSSTAEINRLEQDLEELQATFRQTLTESAYILTSQATFLGKCINHARPYYDAVCKAKQSQTDTQKAALKYERACSSHQAAKKMLTIAEQKLVSTSKEHKVLDPTWQEMLNQAVLKVMESDKERALSEREHLHTARAFSEAGSKVAELRSKLKSAISKSRPYFDLKMKYDQILEAHKRQVEITQEGLQEAKQKYSLALKNLERISEEIHEMRKSRDSLDTILHEREEGVGAESPVSDWSRDAVRPETDLSGQSLLHNKPCYGFKIALVSATRGAQSGKIMTVDEVNSGMPVGERDGDPEGCSSLGEPQLDVVSSQHCESESVMRPQDKNSSTMCDSNTTTTVNADSSSEVLRGESVNSDSNALISQRERTVQPISSCVSTLSDGMETVDAQSTCKEPEQFAEEQQASDPISEISDDQICSTVLQDQRLVVNREDLNTVIDKDSELGHVCEAATQEAAYMTDSMEQKSTSELGHVCEAATQEAATQEAAYTTDPIEQKSTGELGHVCEAATQEAAYTTDPIEQKSTGELGHVCEAATQEAAYTTDPIEQKSTSELGHVYEAATQEAAYTTDPIEQKSTSELGHVSEAATQEAAYTTDSMEQKSTSELGHVCEAATQEAATQEAAYMTDPIEQKSTGELGHVCEAATQEAAYTTDPIEQNSASELGHVCEAATQEAAYTTDSMEQKSASGTADEMHAEDSIDNKSADNFETDYIAIKQETMASETPTEQQSTCS
ncbi:SH3 domain-binding protein 5-like [Desmophyllum pertusum]|uniref:SH3 domain-binding protein 5-like n=1 Tax=Desmophyllum pertusum TaxID=174260 RepID=A0A9X0D784_9CNID|nr:SH3 domain-binding protein 5-like [Desmophyllum pertusum]